MKRSRTPCLALVVDRRVALTAVFVTLAAVLPASSAVNHDPCSTSNLTPGGVGSRGNITSPRYPDSMPPKYPTDPNCRMAITACAGCKIKITFDEFTAPPCHKTEIPIGSCVHQCDHLMMFEPDYPEDTTQYVFDDSTLNSYTTLSNRLTLIVCHTVSNDNTPRKFRLGYEIQEKKRVIQGEVGSPGEVGYFTSPNFPNGYSLHNEVFTFLLENKDPSGLVRLGFDDWNLSPNSRLTIYFHNATHPDGYLTRQGRGERPFVLSSGPSLFIKFETGEDLYAIPYIGFKASYKFVSEPFWPDKPYTVHDEYFYSRYGGEFSFNTQRCWPGDRVDCIWVVTKYNDLNHDQVALNVQSFYVVPDFDSLEIRSGNSSDGLLLGRYEHSNLTGVQFVSQHGFYLRLRATCSNTRRFHAIFASFTNATDDGCTYYYHFQCGNNRCIAKSLVCDGIDHCGDGTDEIGCTTPNPSTRKDCITTYVCRNGLGWYCLTDRCNGHNECEDGTDEFNCWDTVTRTTDVPYLESYYRLGTYIPVVLVIVLLAVIACIVLSCCARRKRNLMRRRQQAGQAGRGLPSISASLPGRGRRVRSASETHLNINVEIQHYPDSPPPYEEAISQSQSANSGIHNMAFSMSDSSDHLMTPPPPYSPRDENPYPMSNPALMAAARGMYMPNQSAGVVIGIPPSGGMPPPNSMTPSGSMPPSGSIPQSGGQYTTPEVARPQIPLTGAADVAGGLDLAQVHGNNGTTTGGRRAQAPGRRRQRHSRQGASSSEMSVPPPMRNDHQIAIPRDNVGNDNSTASNRNSVAGSVGRRGHARANNRGRGSVVNRDSSSPGPPPRPPRRRSSGTSSPIQNFVQSLISRAARQSAAAPPPPTPPLQLTETRSNSGAPATPEQTYIQPSSESSAGTNSCIPPVTEPVPDGLPTSNEPQQRVPKTSDPAAPVSQLETVQESSPSQSQKTVSEDGDKLIHSSSVSSDNVTVTGNDKDTSESALAQTEEVVTQSCDNGDAVHGDPGQGSLVQDSNPNKGVTLAGADDSMTFV